jgi:DNA-binding beta-propeller fold protein YncE
MMSVSRRRFLKTSSIMAGLPACIGLCGSSRSAFARTPNPQAAARGPEPYPIAVTVGNQGTIYVADHEQKTIYRLEGESHKPVVVYKGSRKYRTPLYRVFAMAQDSAGNLFFCDTGSMDVWRMSSDGKLAPLTGQKIARGIGPAPANQDFDPEGAYAGDFDKPMGIAIEADGNLVVADLGQAAIFRIPAAGGKREEIARVPAPHGIAIDPSGGFVVVSQSKDQLVHVSPKGELRPIVKGSLAPKNNPHYVVATANGYFVSDNYAAAVWQVSPDGSVKALAQGEPFVRPVGLAQEPNGNLLVADPHAKKLFRVTLEGKITTLVTFDGAS